MEAALIRRQLVRYQPDDRIAEVMERREIGDKVKLWLRPVGGGREWEAEATEVSDYLDEITGVAEQWLRRCSGQPVAGRAVSAHGLRVVLASSSGVSAGENGVISWHSGGREFTATPVRADQNINSNAATPVESGSARP